MEYKFVQVFSTFFYLRDPERIHQEIHLMITFLLFSFLVNFLNGFTLTHAPSKKNHQKMPQNVAIVLQKSLGISSHPFPLSALDKIPITQLFNCWCSQSSPGGGISGVFGGRSSQKGHCTPCPCICSFSSLLYHVIINDIYKYCIYDIYYIISRLLPFGEGGSCLPFRCPI